MNRHRTVLILGLGSLLLASGASAQQVISARSGMINYTQGNVFLGKDEVQMKFGQNPAMKENEVLRTEDGLVEVLLNPGTFLRMNENSSIRMISNRLIDTRLDVLSGSAMVEVAELLPDNSVTLVYGDAQISLNKAGLYRVDTNPARVRVYKGEALVVSNGQTLTLGSGQESEFGAVLAASRFDPKIGDELYRWSARRAEALAAANPSTANSYRGFRTGAIPMMSGWGWNPYFGMFTYIPYSGIYYSPFGYGFYSPAQVFGVFYAPRVYSTGGGFFGGSPTTRTFDSSVGYQTVGSRSVTTSSSVSAAPASAAAAGSARAGGSGSSSAGGGASRGSSAGGARGH